MADSAKKRGSVMGWAIPGTRIVKVSYTGIGALIGEDVLWSTRREKDVACVLGHVVAHEIGHLLLPFAAHSAGGIMKARLDPRLAAIGGLFFTADQAEDIRAKLARR
jgi:hypothetical protein